MLNHHFATGAPIHRDPRAPRAQAQRSAYPQRRSSGDRRAPRTERKELGQAGCSSHASRYRIPQRSSSRRDHSERPLPSSAGAGLAHCACSVSAAPPPGSHRAAAAPGFARRPTGRGRRASRAWAERLGKVWPGRCGNPAIRLFQVGRVPAYLRQHGNRYLTVCMWGLGGLPVL